MRKPFLPPIPPDAAEGTLAREYDKALRRADRIWGIVAIQSHNAESLRESMRLYSSVMFGESPLTRAQREMIAVVTSQANECVY
jgi:alkylhydroperoxidase family enzyme